MAAIKTARISGLQRAPLDRAVAIKAVLSVCLSVTLVIQAQTVQDIDI